ncbi:glutamate--cysteine ligase [Halomonas cibimaris]|uniref:Glutamate--cysteine ligase n=1 Tax=Halomonas cibimaris TaxID=657012 RepID=A0ABP7LFF4_9GAMM
MSEPLTVPSTLSQRLTQLLPAARDGRLGRLRRGIEKEGLRVEASGHIAQTAHPRALGSKLTHPHITTDYSEALLEYVTPVLSEPREALAFLGDLHAYSYRHLEGEWIWPASMPCRLSGNDSVPIADYGRSNSGLMKHVYRRGLDVRYGRIMQAIAGVHYNVSLPDEMWQALRAIEGQSDTALSDYRSTRYFGLIRNFRRHSWLLLYLFGASPAIDKSFLDGKRVPAKLEPLGEETYIAPYATTLRMSDLGYQNTVQEQLKICFNSLSNYVNTLRNAISTPWPDYQAKGVKVDGEWRQLNANILQIENEYYSDIRPKRVAQAGETPSQALEARGVEYIEVRCLDLDPFEPLGVSEPQMRFLDTFLMWCLLSESPWISDDECDHLDDNRRLVVERGRDPALRLNKSGADIGLREWGEQIMTEMQPVAELLDAAEDATPHLDAIAALAPRLQDAALTPSARLLARLREHGGSFADVVMALAQEQADMLRRQPATTTREALLEEQAVTSRQQQREMDAADEPGFDDFLADYFARARQSRAVTPLGAGDAP